jgi:hypothetical protein
VAIRPITPHALVDSPDDVVESFQQSRNAADPNDVINDRLNLPFGSARIRPLSWPLVLDESGSERILKLKVCEQSSKRDAFTPPQP